MQSKKEVCSYFQRGSCKFGDRCKNLHVKPLQQQQQPKANSFAFGTQAGSQNPQQPNPFGFGVKAASQTRGPADFGSKNNQYKLSENKWNRFSPITNPAASSRQSDGQPQSGNHKCTDPDFCKRQIANDFEHERPLWKLTCYAHDKNLPCDILGDISYEELRAAAYDDAKRGLSLQAIVERERKLVSSKLAEFDKLLHNPYVPPFSQDRQSSLPSAMPNAFPLSTSSASPPVVSSFSQAALISTGIGVRSPEPSGGAFGNSNSVSNSGLSPSAFGANNLQSRITGSNGSHFEAQTHANSPSSGMSSINVSGAFGPGSSIFSTPTISSQILSTRSHQSASTVGQAALEMPLTNITQVDNKSCDANIWLKEKWLPGEIPEEAPPDEFVF